MYSSDFRNGADRSGPASAATTPTACPTCQSAAITTTARKPDANAYWRCGRCGEVWNASRRETRPIRGQTWR